MMDVESLRLVTVICADYCQYVAIALRNLFDSRRGADFNLKWEGMSIRAHRVILEMFLSTETLGWPVQDPVGVKQEILDCDGTSSNNVLESLLEFLYKGEVTVTEEKLVDLLRVAKELDFKMLEDAIVQSYRCQIDGAENEIEFKEETLHFPENVTLGILISNQNRCMQVADQEGVEETLRLQQIDIIPKSGFTLEYQGRHDFDADDNSSNPEELQLPRKNIEGKSGEVSIVDHDCPQTEDSCETADGATNFKISSTATEATKLNICPLCEFQTLVIKSYQQHMRRKHGKNSKGESVTKNKCPHCNFETFITEKYKQHLAGLHGVDTKGEPVTKHKCPHCQYETSHVWNYQAHLAGLHGVDTKGKPVTEHKCPHCPYETSSVWMYQTHLTGIHRITTKGEPAPKHKCPYCEFETLVARNYSRHLANVHGLNAKGDPAPNYKCTLCEFSTTKVKNYRYHSLSVHGRALSGAPALRHKCPECDYTTAFIYKLNRHKNTHAEERPFACELCNYAGKKKPNLVRHMKSFHGKGIASLKF